MLHPGLAAKTAAYLFHINANHAFADGNKRAGVLSALVFLDQNDIDIEQLPPQEELEMVTMDVAAGKMSKEELTAWMRKALKEPEEP